MTGNSGSVYKSQMNCCPRMLPVNIQLSPGLVMLDFYLYHGGEKKYRTGALSVHWRNLKLEKAAFNEHTSICAKSASNSQVLVVAHGVPVFSHQGPFDLHGAVALRQASPGLHDLTAGFPVLPAARAGAAVLPPDLPPPETTQVPQPNFDIPQRALIPPPPPPVCFDSYCFLFLFFFVLRCTCVY